MYSLAELAVADIADVLEEQYGALARWQARALGMSDDAFDRRLTSGAFESKHAGVAVARAWRHHALAPRSAAVLRAGRGTHLSVWSAADLLDVNLRGSSELVHLWVPHADRRPSRAEGLEIRRSSLLSDPIDVTLRQRLPVTTVERAVVDRLGRPMTRRDRESLLAEVLQQRKTNEERLRACAARNLLGARVLRELLGLVLGHDSGLEVELHRIAAGAGVLCEPLVTVVHPDGTRDEVDLLAVAAGVVLEADGWAFHADPAQRKADERRDERLRHIGLIVLRFTAEEIREGAADSRRRILQAARGRAWSPPDGVTLELSAAAAA